MIFKRKRRAHAASGEPRTAPGEAPVDDEFVDDLDEEDRAYEDALLLAELEEQEQARPAPPRPQGPWDAADAPEQERPRLDLGGLLVPVPPDTEVRVDVDEAGEVVAATLVQGDAAMQVNAFAAPRSEGISGEVLDEIAAALTAGGGSAQSVEGPYGPELHAQVPTQAPDGRIVMAAARFVGVDGPRWFLRALLTGTAATDAVRAAPLEAALREVVVVRGSEPMAVRDPLPLRLPPQAVASQDGTDQDGTGQEGTEQEGGGQDGGDRGRDPLELAERGPEITETR